MQCPDHSYLMFFARDPDAALDDLPVFEEHLSECEACRQAIEKIADGLHGERPLEMVLGSDETDLNSEFPHVPGYRLVDAIRSGGSGTVYRGVHLASGRGVAVKVIQSVVPTHWKRIVLERESLVQCDHPNIVTLLDYGQIPGGCYFVTRWMERSLSEYLTQNSVVDLRQALEWMRQIADAVRYVHALGIVHRDLKPSNILLNAMGRPKLTDFGIAKQVLSEEGLTTTGVPIGTPGYMAPEQTGRIETPISFATDVYGLGAVLYSILTGRPPFMSGNSVQVLDQIVSSVPVSPRQLRPDVPRDLERICLKCLEKLPADRYLSTTELIDDLNRYSEGLPVKARPIVAVVRWLRLARSQPVVTSLVGLVALVLFMATIGAFSMRRNAQSQQRESDVRAALQSLATSSPDRVESLLERLQEVDTQSVKRQIEILRSEGTGDDLSRLRWSCANQSPHLALNCDQLQSAFASARAQEYPILLRCLRSHPAYTNPVFRNSMRATFEALETNDGMLPMVCLLAAIDDTWSPKNTEVFRALNQLTRTPASESIYWSQALEPVSAEFFQALELDPSSTGNSLYWDSYSIQNIIWQWSQKDANQVIHYIKKAPLEALKLLVELPDVTRSETLRLLKAEFQSLRRLANQGPSNPLFDVKPADFEKVLRQDLAEPSGETKSNQSNVNRLASIAIGAWILGDAACALESMNEQRDPNLRTQIVEWIGRLDSNGSHFLEAFRQSSTSNQLYGLLVAQSNWRQEQFEPHRKDFLPLLRQLWNNDDPGVHFAADHLLRIAYPKDACALVDARLSATHGLTDNNRDRRWFYGPFGLPFVIFERSDFELAKTDDRLAWLKEKSTKATTLDYRVAVCAIETPEWLMKTHRNEMQQLGAEAGLSDGDFHLGPARGHRIDSMLRFCRWLNQMEGLDLTLVQFSDYPNMEPGPELPEDYLTREGYRLPNRDEWEMVCRAGSWTRHFLGDSLDFIDQYAWTCENPNAQPGEVGVKKPSPNGMFDILGNVYETVLGDSMENGYGYWNGSTTWRYSDAELVHLRGGSFLSHRIYCSSGVGHGIRVGCDINAGFRIFRTLKSERALHRVP